MNTPLQQMRKMIEWFFGHGSSSLDIHLRCPRIKGISYYDERWYWITSHANLSKERAFELLKWCRYKNFDGADVYIRPHRHNAHPIIFLDDLTINKANSVSEKYTSLAVETSLNNTQVWVQTTKSLSEAERLCAQRYIASTGYSDKGSISGEHLGRMCGLRSHKRNCWVNLIQTSTQKKYQAKLEQPPYLSPRGACAKNSLNNSESEFEFSESLRKIRKGESIEAVKLWLTQKANRRGKRQPEKYSERTVEKVNVLLN